MVIPDFQTAMLPLLELTSARPEGELSLQEAVENLANRFELTDEQRRHLLPSGRQPTFHNRVGWAATYLRKACLLEATRRSYFKITERGLAALRERPQKITIKYLSQFPEFVEFKARRKEQDNNGADEEESAETRTPEEILEAEHQKIRDNLASQLLDRIKQSSPAFFETLVVELLVKMGYGGSRSDAGKAVGRSGDGGIDGIIKEDKLGLDTIYIQAKRWDGNPVGRREVQQFARALQGQRANKGIFLTTSRFTDEASTYAATINSKIVLIDGEQLTQLMIDYNLGVSLLTTYEIKRIDSDYFTELV
jgi:restriction system protein